MLHAAHDWAIHVFLAPHLADETYDRTLSPYYAAANLWVDAIIDPRSTREVLDHLLWVACGHDPEERFNLGVFQV